MQLCRQPWRSTTSAPKAYPSHQKSLWQGYWCGPLQRQHRRLVPNNIGVRQGCLLSPTLFNIFLERIMTDALEDHEGTVSIGGRTITNLRFADDIDGLAGEEEKLANLVERSTKPPQPNTSHGNEVLPQDTTHLIQRPCYQWGSPCQDPAGNWTTRRPPDHRKETQTAVVWSCLPFIRSGQNHLARHSERGKKTRQTEEEVGRQHQGMDRPGVRQVPEGSGEQGKMEKTGCKIICGAPTTLAVKG